MAPHPRPGPGSAPPPGGDHPGPGRRGRGLTRRRTGTCLLEYYLYEISALGAKHTYLLQMKSLGLEDSPGP